MTSPWSNQPPAPGTVASQYGYNNSFAQSESDLQAQVALSVHVDRMLIFLAIQVLLLTTPPKSVRLSLASLSTSTTHNPQCQHKHRSTRRYRPRPP